MVYQSYVEPKGTHLLEQDSWKEEFSLEIEKSVIPVGLFSQNYKIIGLPFFNNENRIEEFEKSFISFLDKI